MLLLLISGNFSKILSQEIPMSILLCCFLQIQILKPHSDLLNKNIFILFKGLNLHFIQVFCKIPSTEV
jgi:hypothetical protein